MFSHYLQNNFWVAYQVTKIHVNKILLLIEYVTFWVLEIILFFFLKDKSLYSSGHSYLVSLTHKSVFLNILSLQS